VLPRTSQDAQEPPVREVGRTPVLQRVSSSDLLKDAREIVIEHAGEEYRLRLTSKGKLILTK
jgi:hemin uptake protein HemP